MHEEEGFSIWFFVGIMLAIYGPIVLIANIPGLSTSQNPHVVLEELHAGVWWGILLTILAQSFFIFIGQANILCLMIKIIIFFLMRRKIKIEFAVIRPGRFQSRATRVGTVAY